MAYVAQCQVQGNCSAVTFERLTATISTVWHTFACEYGYLHRYIIYIIWPFRLLSEQNSLGFRFGNWLNEIRWCLLGYFRFTWQPFRLKECVLWNKRLEWKRQKLIEINSYYHKTWYTHILWCFSHLTWHFQQSSAIAFVHLQHQNFPLGGEVGIGFYFGICIFSDFSFVRPARTTSFGSPQWQSLFIFFF